MFSALLGLTIQYYIFCSSFPISHSLVIHIKQSLTRRDLALFKAVVCAVKDGGELTCSDIQSNLNKDDARRIKAHDVFEHNLAKWFPLPSFTHTFVQTVTQSLPN